MDAFKLFTRIIAALLCGVALSANAAGITCNLPSVPSGSRVEMVTPDMRVNGVATTVRSIESSMTVEGVLAFYRSLWAPLATSKRPGSMEQTVQGWNVISTVDGTCFTTVQVKAKAGGSYALLSVSQRPDSTTQRSASVTNFPALAGSKVMRDTDYVDAVRNARSVVISNSSSPMTNANYYLSTLKLQGWDAVLQRQPESAKGVNYVLVFKRGFEEMNVVISPASDGGSTVVANVTDRP